MLFRPFTVETVDLINKAQVTEITAAHCGLLVCIENTGSSQASAFHHRAGTNTCYFSANQPISPDLFDPHTQFAYIQIKINHVDYFHSLTGAFPIFTCKDSFIHNVYNAAKGNVQALEMVGVGVECLLANAARKSANVTDCDVLGAWQQSRASSFAEETCRRVLLYLESNIREPFSVDQIASVVNCSPRRLNSIMQSSYGCTILEFINDYRLKKAKALLMITDLSVSEISDTCGFTSPSYFCRLFKEREGVPPRAFRKPVPIVQPLEIEPNTTKGKEK